MKMKKADAVAVLLACKFQTAAKWDAEKVQAKINQLNEIGVEDDILKGIKDKKIKKMVKDVLKALDAEKEITVLDDEKKSKKDKGDDKKSKKGKKGKSKSDDDEEEDEEEDEEDEEEEDDSDDEEDEEEDEEDGDDDEEDEDEDEDEEDDDDEPKKKGKKGKKVKKGKKEKKEKKEAVEKDWAGCRLNTRAHRINMAITEKPRTIKEILEKANYDKPIHGHLKGMLEKRLIVKVDKKGKTAFIRNPNPGKKYKPAK